MDPLPNQVLLPTTYLETLLNMFKGIVGTGILSLPHAMSQVGYILGTVGLIFFTFISLYCSYNLVICQEELCLRHKRATLSYEETVEVALLHGPDLFKVFSPYSKKIIEFLIVISLFGTACVYNVIIAANIKVVIDPLIGETHLMWYIISTLPFLMLVNLVKHLKYIAKLSGISNVFVLTSIVCIFYYTFQNVPSYYNKLPVNNISALPQFAGTVLFATGCFTLILPIKNEMETPKYFLKKPFGVLYTGYLLVLILYWMFSVAGYFSFGNEVKDVITLNLPQGEIGSKLVQLCLSIATLGSTPLNFYLIFEAIVNNYLRKKENVHNMKEQIIRNAVIILSVFISCVVPNLGLMVSLVGIFSSCLLSMFVPCFVHFLTFSSVTPKKSVVSVFFFDAIVLVVAVLIFFPGIFNNVKEIIKPYI